MSITVFEGAMGSGKTFSAVQLVILLNLKIGRTVCTNITGLDIEKIAAHLNRPVSALKARLLIFEDSEINDDFWPTEDGGGKVPWGAVLVIDEAWKWFREKSQLTPRLMDFIRKHRKWAAGDPPMSCEIVLITQSRTDLRREIFSVIEQIFKVEKNPFSGLNSMYRLSHIQPGQRTPLSVSNHKYDKRIFDLYKSHAVDGVVEQAATTRGAFWHSRQFMMASVAAVLAIGGGIYFLPKLVSGQLLTPSGMKAHAAKPGSLDLAHPATTNSTASIIPAVPSPETYPGLAMGQAPETFSVPQGAGTSSLLSPEVGSRVLTLRGDPEAVSAVGKAFCSKAGGCDLVVNAASQQIVLVGDPVQIDKLQKLLGQLAIRPAGQLVKLIVFELDTTRADDFNVYMGIKSGATSFTSGALNGAGTVGTLSLGQFTLGFNKLVGNGSVRLISSPSVMIWPGQESQIKSGFSVPILGSIIVDSAGRQSQVVDYRDSGLILNIAQVSSGDRPVVKISIESSSYGETTVGVSGQPTKSLRTITTMAELNPCGVTILGGIDQVMDQDQKQKFLGFTTKRADDDKVSRVFVALEATGGSGAQACAAATPAATKAS